MYHDPIFDSKRMVSVEVITEEEVSKYTSKEVRNVS